MKILRTKEAVKSELSILKNSQTSIGFVPTMGALHEGHLDLIKKAKLYSDYVVVSIFVNPTQFNNTEDFDKYPQTLDKDMVLLKEIEVDCLFLPEIQEIYPRTPRLKMVFEGLDNTLEGEFRPGHFSGVGVVVAKLLNIVNPHKAFFGQKDLQQVAVIRQLIYDLSLDVEIIALPTVREASGLALSSRNMRLSIQEKKEALILIESLTFAKSELLAGKDWLSIRNQIEDRFSSQNIRLEYFELVNSATMEKINSIEASASCSICTAAYVGDVRLIDNITVIED
ncbi:pantoate--beta-alanine ligase [Mongoliibacter ruber]|nr:pantoate--beta-alanine ligase [Mongoliibacter ruber]